MAVYKNIIFDLGGVLLNIDYKRTATAFAALEAHQFDQFYSQTTANRLFEDLETGNISEEDFYKTMQNFCRPNTSFEEIKLAWNAILLDFRIESMAYLKKLQPHYNLYLLSNTNHIHHQAFEKLLQQQIGDISLTEYFNAAYFSHEIKRRKPYESTYRFILEKLNIKGSETLFIDDSPINIPGAQAAGIHTHLLLPSESIENLGLL
jgi:glucose-1-phosphatase